MPTYSKCPKAVHEMAQSIILKHDAHRPIKNAQAIIDLLFAMADVDDAGKPVNHAIIHQGYPVHGLTRIINLKDRTKGHGDAEIILDFDWWKEASVAQREALLDHELTHICVKTSRTGTVKTDDLGRPKLSILKHDVQVGWFMSVALRNGDDSLERIQAKKITDKWGQLLWPEIANAQPTA